MGELVIIFAGKTSLQFKFGMSYILIILAVLALLNTYPLLISQSLVFHQGTAMKSKVSRWWSRPCPVCRSDEEKWGRLWPGGDRRVPPAH